MTTEMLVKEGQELDLECPGRMLFDPVFVTVTDQTQKRYEGEGMVRKARVTFAWIGANDTLMMDSDKHSQEEIDKFVKRFKEYHGAQCSVVFKVAVSRGREWGNNYRLLDVAKIKVAGKKDSDSPETTSPSRRLGGSAS